MVDSALFTGSNAAGESLRSMSIIANNLANINTAGFHADYKTMASVHVKNKVAETRVMASPDRSYVDTKQGPVSFTGRDLDVAINGPGYLSVQNKEGKEAYTRSGSLDITPQGLLVSNKGDLILGLNGVITVPPSASVTIDGSGVVYARIKGEAQTTLAEIGRMKMVEIPDEILTKGTDGLYYPAGGASATVSQTVKLVPESLEGSNVDAVRSLTELIDTSRQFDMNAKMMSAIDENAGKANQLLDVTA